MVKRHTFSLFTINGDRAVIDETVHQRKADPPSPWFELLLDGAPIGQCRMEKDAGGWRFVFESDDHELRVGGLLAVGASPPEELRACSNYDVGDPSNGDGYIAGHLVGRRCHVRCRNCGRPKSEHKW